VESESDPLLFWVIANDLRFAIFILSLSSLISSQCVFIRGFCVARSLWILPGRLKAAAGPSLYLGGYNCDDTEVISIPAVTKVTDSVRIFSVFSDV
jgi:hypothetical protein